MPENHKSTVMRANIIRAIETPLGFFSLVVLTVEVLFSIIALMSKELERTLLIVGMLVLIFVLVAIVVFLAVWRPESLSGQRPIPIVSERLESIPQVLRIQKPKILCASTPQFEKLGFERDVEIIRKISLGSVQVEHDLNSSQFQNLLIRKKFDVIHLLAYIEPSNSNLVFSEGDSLTYEAFAQLIKICQAQLVVLASCDSIDLAARVSRTTNIIAATTIMQTNDFIKWAELFYQLLAQGHSLARAYDIATVTAIAPMVLLMKQDMTFS